MSHFAVMVIGENIEEQLEKYSEHIEVPEYVTGEVSDEDKKRFIEYYTKEKNIIGEVLFEELYRDYGNSWNNNSWVVKDGVWVEVSTYNPLSKWDWYEVGGRWTGFLKMKNNIQLFSDKIGFSVTELEKITKLYNTDKEKFSKIVSKYVGKVDEIIEFVKIANETPNPKKGKGGVFGNVAEEGCGDQMLKSEIDLIGMQEKAKSEAIEVWNKANEIINGEMLIEWSQFLSMVDNNEIDFNTAREKYNNQSVVKRWNESKEFGFFSNIEDYNVPIEEYISRKVNSVISTYAIVKDGNWYAKGEMGWFGMSDDKQTQDEWNEQLMKMFNELPDDTLITIVDCHI